jgi:hypothetical protein
MYFKSTYSGRRKNRGKERGEKLKRGGKVMVIFNA